MNRKLLVVGLVVSAVINLVAIFTFGSYWREESRRRHGPPPPPVAGNPEQALSRLKERFQLTDTQMDTMRVLHEFRRTSLKPVRDRLDSLLAEILALLQAPELNKAHVDSLLQRVVAAQDTLETGTLGLLLRMRNALTPEQRLQLPELFKDFQRAGQRPGKGPRPGPGGESPPDQPPPQGPGRR